MVTCHLCQAVSSRTLEEHVTERHPVLDIDTQSFQLITKNLNDSYLLVKIKNIESNFSFIVYRSNSHGGIFRLCTLSEPYSSHLYKGDSDYVTQTFIHINLQKFIIRNLAKIIVDDTLRTSTCPYNGSNIKPSDPLLHYNDMIDNPRRKYEYKTLDRLVGINCGYGFSNIKEMIEYISGMHNLYSIHSLMKAFMTIINPSFDVETLSRRPSAYTGLILETYGRSNPTIRTNKMLVRTYLKFISSYLKNEFAVLPETIESLYGDTFTIPKIEGVEIRMTYYSVIIKSKENDGIKFSVIYALYDILSDIHRELNGRYSITFNIIPIKDQSSGANENQINSVGLYKYYMSIGIYLCKIFEYVEQARAVAERSYGGYLFMGDLYTNLFPVRNLYNDDLKTMKL